MRRYTLRRQAARVVLLDPAGSVLLLQANDPADAQKPAWWEIPGGGIDHGESSAEAARRELWEETGLEVTVRKLAAVYDRARHPHLPPRPFHIYKLFFVCDIVGGEAQTSSETSEVAFFAEDEVPSDLSIGRVLPYQITRMFEHVRSSALPTDFD